MAMLTGQSAGIYLADPALKLTAATVALEQGHTMCPVVEIGSAIL
jgi:hypothetical protein